VIPPVGPPPAQGSVPAPVPRRRRAGFTFGDARGATAKRNRTATGPRPNLDRAAAGRPGDSPFRRRGPAPGGAAARRAAGDRRVHRVFARRAAHVRGPPRTAIARRTPASEPPAVPSHPSRRIVARTSAASCQRTQKAPTGAARSPRPGRRRRRRARTRPARPRRGGRSGRRPPGRTAGPGPAPRGRAGCPPGAAGRARPRAAATSSARRASYPSRRPAAPPPGTTSVLGRLGRGSEHRAEREAVSAGERAVGGPRLVDDRARQQLAGPDAPLERVQHRDQGLDRPGELRAHRRAPPATWTTARVSPTPPAGAGLPARSLRSTVRLGRRAPGAAFGPGRSRVRLWTGPRSALLIRRPPP
jgi:hypothetical protein